LSETRWTQSVADDCALTRVNEITAIEAVGSRILSAQGTDWRRRGTSAGPRRPASVL